MSDPRAILDGIENKLLDLPETKFVEIVSLLEQIGDHPRVREAIGTVRPRIARVRPARRLTLRRVFCDPFEDLLVPAADGAAPLRPIDRSIIIPLWQVVETCADPGELAPLRRKAGQLSDQDSSQRHTLGCRLWMLAARVLRNAIEDVEANPSLRTAFIGGGEDRLEQARDIVELLDAGHAVARLKSVLSPKPVGELGDAEAALIGELIQETARAAPRRVYHLLLIAASRLRRPADLLGALEGLDFGRARRDKADVCAALSGMIVNSLEASGRSGVEHPPAEGPEVVDRAERLLDSLSATRNLMERARDSRFDTRLDEVRQAVRTMVDAGVLDKAEMAILDGLPELPSTDGSLTVPDPQRQEKAEDYARALRRCQLFARELGLDLRVAATLDTVGNAVDARLGTLLAGAGDRDDEAYDLSVAYSLRLLELVRGLSSAAAPRFDVLRLLMDDESETA